MAASKRIQAITPLIHGYILDLLVQGIRPMEIEAKCVDKYKLSPRSIQRHMRAVKTDIAKSVDGTIETIRATLHERYERIYRESAGIEQLGERLDMQRKTIASHADLFGFGRQRDNSGNTTINIALLLPDSIREAIRPTEYTIETQEQGEGDGMQQEQS
jgi:hypothetical protein